jgi:hypothetical protein
MARSRFVQTLDDGRLKEQRDGGAQRSIERGYVLQGGPLVKVRDTIGGGVRVLAKAMYLSPVFVFARLIAHYAVDPLFGAVVVVVFVTLVLAFFTLLCLYLLASFVAWNQSKRTSLARPHAALAHGVENADEQDLGKIVTVTGRAVALDETHLPLVSDFWTPRVRLAEASVFAIERDAPHAPVVVIVTTAPIVIARAEETTTALAVSPATYQRTELLDDQRGDALAVRAGEKVTLTGQLLDRIPNVSEFELDGEMYRLQPAAATDEGTPYREAQIRTGLLVSDQLTMPIVIEVG